MGDRFAHQGEAQLRAILEARKLGLPLYPVWNKSNREHTIVKTHPRDLRAEADAAVQALGWSEDYFVDADHIGLKTVIPFLQSSNFFTLDVADFVGQATSERALAAFLKFVHPYLGTLTIPGLPQPFALDEALVLQTARKFLLAIENAGLLQRVITENKGFERFVTEVSIDETDTPQTPVELFLILAMIAQEKIPAQTIAPKFTGRFNKGVDYVGDQAQFAEEFEADLQVVSFAIQEFDLPPTLKLSIHSGSDKFSLYPIINRLLKKNDAGLHVKTAGTTWLEEVISLAEAGDDGLAIARDIYAGAYARFDELTTPYATVIDIRKDRLPPPDAVATWTGEKFANTLRHDSHCPDYLPEFRQLVHVGFKIAAEMGDRYLAALQANRERVGANVTHNLLARHIQPLFG